MSYETHFDYPNLCTNDVRWGIYYTGGPLGQPKCHPGVEDRRHIIDATKPIRYMNHPDPPPSVVKYRFRMPAFAFFFGIGLKNVQWQNVEVKIAMRYGTEPADYPSNHSTGFVNHRTWQPTSLQPFIDGDILYNIPGFNHDLFTMWGPRIGDSWDRDYFENAGDWFYVNVFANTNQCFRVLTPIFVPCGAAMEYCDHGTVPPHTPVTGAYQEIWSGYNLCSTIMPEKKRHKFSWTSPASDESSFRIFIPPKLCQGTKLKCSVTVISDAQTLGLFCIRYGAAPEQDLENAHEPGYYLSNPITLQHLREEVVVSVQATTAMGFLLFEISDAGFHPDGAWLYVGFISGGEFITVSVEYEGCYENLSSFCTRTYGEHSTWDQPVVPRPGEDPRQPVKTTLYTPWNFYRQADKFGYINNPRWTEEMAHENDHEPCGYWYKEWPAPYYPPALRPIWEPSSMCIDTENRLLYTTCVRNYVGAKNLRKVFATCLDTFRHVRAWGLGDPAVHDNGILIGPRSPAPYFGPIMGQHHVWWNTDIGDKYLIPVSKREGYHLAEEGEGGDFRIDVLNARTNIITSHDLTPGGPSGRDADCYNYWHGVYFRPSPILTTAHSGLNRVYVVMMNPYYYRRVLEIGYISVDSGDYTRLVCELNTLSEGSLMSSSGGNTPFRVYPERDRMMLTGLSPFNRTNDRYVGHLSIWNMSGDVIDKYRYTTHPHFPVNGIGSAVWHPNGYIYGRVKYYSMQADYRGLCRVSPSSGQVVFYRPPWAPNLQNYAFLDISVGVDHKLYMNHYGYGVAVFDPSDETWMFLDAWDTPGLHPVLQDLFNGRFTYGVQFDLETMCVYSGYGKTLWNVGPWTYGHQDLNWFPQTPGSWGCYIARHPLVPQPKGWTPGAPKVVTVPMIWKMPNTGD